MTCKTLGQAAAPSMRALADSFHTQKADRALKRIRQAVDAKCPDQLERWAGHLADLAHAWRRDQCEFAEGALREAGE